MAQDYSTARYFAISGIGYGKGFTAEEAVENYVTAQLRNHPAKTTIFKTKPKWEEALRIGEAKAQVWLAPEGFTGFVMGIGSHWTRTLDDGTTEHRAFQAEDKVELIKKPTHELDEVEVRGHPFDNDHQPNEKFVTVEVGEVVLNLSPGEARHFARDLEKAVDKANGREYLHG